MESIVIDQDRCTLCGACAEVCVRQIIDDSGDTLKLTAPENCIFCGHCKAVCPEDAIEIPSLNSEEFIAVPDKDEFPSPDNLLNFFRYRRSTRIFQDKPVEKQKIEKIIEAGRFAPTGGNFQALRYVVAHTPEKIDEIRNLAFDALLQYADTLDHSLANTAKNGKSLSITDTIQKNYARSLMEMAKLHEDGIDKLLWNAPALIVTHVSKLVDSPGVDAGLAAMQMVLMAEALGLGTCFIGFIVMAAEISPDLKKVLQIPENHQTVVSFVTGYPDVSFQRLVSRKPARKRWL